MTEFSALGSIEPNSNRSLSSNSTLMKHLFLSYSPASCLPSVSMMKSLMKSSISRKRTMTVGAGPSRSTRELKHRRLLENTTRYQASSTNISIIAGKALMCQIVGIVESASQSFYTSKLLAEFYTAWEQGNTLSIKNLVAVLHSAEAKQLDLDVVTPDTSIPLVLLDLIMYDSAALTRAALDLLVKQYCKLGSLLQHADKIEVLEADEDVRRARHITGSLNTLKSHFQVVTRST